MPPDSPMKAIQGCIEIEYQEHLAGSPSTMADQSTSDAAQNVPPEDEAQPAPPSARTVRSEDLFAGQRVVLIQHAGEEYRLMITRNDRLILQK